MSRDLDAQPLLSGPERIISEMDQMMEFGHICCSMTDCTSAWHYEARFKKNPDIKFLLCRFHFGLAADNELLASAADRYNECALETGYRLWWGDWRAA